jgi:hypothetical protein
MLNPWKITEGSGAVNVYRARVTQEAAHREQPPRKHGERQATRLAGRKLRMPELS